MDEDSKKVGFTSYTWKDVPISPITIDRQEWEACRMYSINPDSIQYRKPSAPKKPKLWSEIKYRLSAAWGALRYGRDYFD